MTSNSDLWRSEGGMGVQGKVDVAMQCQCEVQAACDASVGSCGLL